MPRYVIHTDSDSLRHQVEKVPVTGSTTISFTERHAVSPSLMQMQPSHGEGSQPRRNVLQEDTRSSGDLQEYENDVPVEGEEYDVEVRIEQKAKVQYLATDSFRESYR